VEPHGLPLQFGLNLTHVQLIEATLLLHCDRRRHAGALPGDCTAHHVAGGRVTDAITAGDPTGTD
jgi:hypothetical protein